METKGNNGKVSGRGIVVTLDMKKRIKSLRDASGLSIDCLAKKSGVGNKTLKKIESSTNTQERFDEDTLLGIASAFNCTLAELQGKESCLQEEDVFSFEFLAGQFREIDHMLLPLIRDHRHAGRRLVEKAYQSLLAQCLQAREIDIDNLNRSLKEPIKRASFLRGLPKPGLIIDISDNFGKISYQFSPNKKLIVKSPKLLWDCHCDTPSHQGDEFNCPIHSHKLGEEVDRRFSNGYILIRYRDVEFYWRAGQELWPPSIDSFYMMEVMKEDGLFTKKYNSVVDIGSGTGFLGIVAAFHNPYITEIILSDWLLTPYLYGTSNWFLNRDTREHIDLRVNTSLFAEGLESVSGLYDIAICNPPYLPLLKGFGEIGLESTVAGTDLLTEVVLKSKQIASKTYLQFSSLAKPEAAEAQKQAGVKLRPIGKERLVPFRVCVLWERNDYLDVLVKERGLIEKKNSRHRFWHKIQTYVIE